MKHGANFVVCPDGTFRFAAVLTGVASEVEQDRQVAFFGVSAAFFEVVEYENRAVAYRMHVCRKLCGNRIFNQAGFLSAIDPAEVVFGVRARWRNAVDERKWRTEHTRKEVHREDQCEECKHKARDAQFLHRGVMRKL